MSNRIRPTLFGLCAVVGCLLTAAVTSAQTPSLPPPRSGSSVGLLPESLITNDQPSPADNQTIVNFINAQASLLSGPVTAKDKTKDARGALIINSSLNSSNTQNTTSAAFALIYDQTLNAALQPLAANPKTSDEVRLNIAIIVAKVALKHKTAKVGNNALLPTVELMVESKDTAICMWGIRGLGAIIGAEIDNKPTSKLPDVILKAVQDHQSKGLIVNEAYKAFSPEPNSTLLPGTQAILLTNLIALYQQRVNSYKTGIPDSPAIESVAVLALFTRNNWTLMTSAQQLQVIQLTVDLLNMDAQYLQRASLASDAAASLIYTVHQIASNMEVLGGIINNAGISGAAGPMKVCLAPQLPSLIPPLITAIKGTFQIKESPTIAPEGSPTTQSNTAAGGSAQAP